MNDELDSAPRPATGHYRIDPTRDRLLALRRLPAWFESRTGERMHRSVGYRWAKHGVRGLRLPTIRLGSARFTSEEAISWWSAAIDGADAGTAAAPAAVAGTTTEDDATLRRAGVQ